MPYDLRSDVAFIPDKVVVGKFYADAKGGQSYVGGFVTCRFKHEKWVSPSVFERLCGFKPNVQRDAEKELKKAIKNAVDEIDNVPVSGFKIAGFCDNIYKRSSKDYHVKGDVVIEDPRGFYIGISAEDVFSLLDRAGGNLKGHEFEGLKLAYGWGVGMTMHLVAESDPWYEKAKAKSQKVPVHSKLKSVRKSELTIGKAYRTFSSEVKKTSIPDGTYVYMGIHDTYSINCHREAMLSGVYHHQKFIDGESHGRGDVGRNSTSGKMVFYHVGAKWDGKDIWKKSSSKLPYYLKADISQMFECEVEIPEETMHNSSLPVTYENIKEDMSKCLLFNKLDFTSPIGRVDCSRALFEALYGFCSVYGIEPLHASERPLLDTFPEIIPYARIFWSAAKQDWIKLQSVMRDRNARTSDWTVRQSSRSKLAAQISWTYSTRPYYADVMKGLTYDEVYDLLKPQRLNLKLENGHELPEEQAIYFADPAAEDALNVYYY